MKTIAISIDDDTLHRVDSIIESNSVSWKSRSEVIRQAVRQFVEALERRAEEERESKIFRRHASSLSRQATALVREQAKP